MEQSFWQSNGNRNCRVAFGTVNAARPDWSVALQGDGIGTLKSAQPIGTLRTEEFNEGQAFYLSVESGIGSDKLIVQFACQGNIDGVVDRNVIVKGKVERFLEQIWGLGR